MRIGEILLERAAITPEALAQGLADQNKPAERLGEALVRLGLVAERDVAAALAEQTGLETIDLSETRPEPKALKEVPIKIVLDAEVVPIARHNGTITVALADPFAVERIDEIRLLTGCTVEPVIATPTDIREALRRHYGLGAESLDRATQEIPSFALLEDEDASEENALEMAEDAALVQFVNQLLLEAVRDRASDVHVEPAEHELRIRNRIDGVLHDVSVPPQIKRFQAAITSRLKIMAELDIAEKRLPQDGRIKLRAEGREVDVRVSIIPTLFGESVVLRLLDREGEMIRLTDIGMAGDTLETYREIMSVPYGIFLVTGPTGSGKTTSLYAGMSELDHSERKIITIEDPVEYRLPGASQINVRSKIGLSFAAGLRSILRHDPDIVMVGEIRDRETAEIAIQAALTGHLVLSTLHTNDAASSITRLVDMGVEPYLVASTVEGVMAQRLVRKVCPSCVEEHRVDDDELAHRILHNMGVEDIEVIRRGKGCDDCRGTGYRGRIGIFELFPLDDEAREITLVRASAEKLRQYAREHGIRALREDGIRLVRDGRTTPEEVLRVAGRA